MWTAVSSRNPAACASAFGFPKSAHTAEAHSLRARWGPSPRVPTSYGRMAKVPGGRETAELHIGDDGTTEIELRAKLASPASTEVRGDPAAGTEVPRIGEPGQPKRSSRPKSHVDVDNGEELNRSTLCPSPKIHTARRVGRATPLRDDALKPALARCLPKLLTVPAGQIGQSKTGRISTQRLGKHRSAVLERIRPQVLAVELQDVESPEESVRRSLRLEPGTDSKIRRAPPCLDQLPVDHGRADAQFRQSRANRRRAARPVAAAGGEQARLAAVEHRDGAAAAMHGLMPPLRPSRRPSDGLGKRGRKKDGRNTSKADLAQTQASRQFRTGSGLFKIHRCRANRVRPSGVVPMWSFPEGSSISHPYTRRYASMRVLPNLILEAPSRNSGAASKKSRSAQGR